MFSAVKNFFLTFIIAIFVFIFVAYPIADFIVINLAEANLDAGANQDPSNGGSQNDPNNNGNNSFYGDGGTSTNILLVMTDYRPSTFSNYDPEQLKALYGIEPESVTPSTPDDVSEPAKLPVQSDLIFDDAPYYVADDGSLVFKDGFYEVPYKKINTTSIILLRIDKERGHTSFTAFPTDAYVTLEDKYVQLGDIYANYGLQFLIDRIHALTGISIDNHILTSYETFPALVNSIMPRGVSYTVPSNLYLNDMYRDIFVNLPIGRRVLDGEKALQLITYDAYTDGANSKMFTTVKFMRELYTQYTNITNYSSAFKTLPNIIGKCYTDLTKEKLIDSIDMMFKYSTSQMELNVPTAKKLVGSRTLLVIDDDDSIRAFSNYRKIYN
jgi:anionic cell wall polymer biosynthesis LytR-Cps2A-Psr (LCP) family protein